MDDVRLTIYNLQFKNMKTDETSHVKKVNTQKDDYRRLPCVR